MKKLFFVTALLISAVSFGQQSSATGPVGHRPLVIPYTGNPLPPTYLSNIIQPLKIFDKLNISGSPYFSEEYKPGFVKVKSGFVQNNVPVRFNIYSNEIEFQLNNREQVLDSVDFVVYLETAGDSSTTRVLKAGYPEVGANNATTIYEVLAMGEKAHLLKHTTQKIEEKRVMGTSQGKELVTYSALYLFNVEKKNIEKVKNPKSQLAEIFPQYSKAIEKMIKEQDLNVKKEADLGTLVANLNGSAGE